MQDIYQRQGAFNHLNTLKSMADSGGLFDSLEAQQSFGTDSLGMANRIAGLAIYNQVNLNTPILGALPSIDRTGDETINVMSDSPAATFRAAFNPPSTSGVAGGGSLPSTSEWDFRTVEARPKIVTMGIDTDFIVDIENRLGHDTVGLEELLELGEQYVQRSLERDNVARGVDAGTTDQYADDDLMVMLDRVVSSAGEESSGGDAFDGTNYSDGDMDVYDVDRSATGADGSNESNWFDATVNHGSGTLRQLTSDLINDTIDTQVQDSSAEYENLVLITGRDTARVMSDLRESQFRADALAQPGREDVNDADTRFGVNFSSRISHWDGIPLVVAPSVPGQSLSRIFSIDPTPGQVSGDGEALPKIGVENYRTPDAWRAGPDQPVNPIATGNVSQEAYWAYYPEIVCREPGAMMKISEIEE
jgi:hypothetical protein